MKKTKLLLVLGALVLFIGIITPVHVFAQSTILFQDNFDGSKKESWKWFWGDWNFGGEQKGLSVTTDDSVKDWPFIVAGITAGWTDYVIEVELENVPEGGVIFRSTNPREGVDTFGGYYIGYDSSFIFFGRDNNGQWKTVPDDGPNAPAAKSLPYAPKMHWTIVVQGNTFTMFLNRGQRPFIQTRDNTYKSGGVGFRHHILKGDESGCFKNLKVTKLEPKQKYQPPRGQ